MRIDSLPDRFRIRSIILIALGGFALGLALLPTVARGADETATASFSIKSQSGNLFRQALRPANFNMEVEVRAPYPESPKVLPMKRVTLGLPTDMRFVPKSNFPVCPDNQIGPPPVNLSVPPDVAIARCPGAVIGNGTAGLYLAGANNADGPFLKDPVLVVFNGGRTKAGLPKIKVYGFSKGTSAGVYMEGVLQNNGTLAVSIPVLTSDSAVGRFNLAIPATQPIVYNNRSVPGSVGRDRSYVQSRCSTGSWRMTSTFLLGNRNDAGQPVGEESTITAAPVSDSCFGAVGTPRFAAFRTSGPKKMKARGRAVFRVRVTNNGTAVMNRIRVFANGPWIRRANVNGGTNLWPGASRWVRVPVRMNNRARRNRSTRITFRATAQKTKVRTGSRWVRVR
ncbi:MAG: hypothetical protein M9938_04840 [Solirubrobacterales bacterium]|nr:hypothetical protein [Solirubrobacterales bacterium]